jgi:hypothetical protein
MEFHLAEHVDEVLALALLPAAPESAAGARPAPKSPPKTFPAKARRPVVV